MVKKDMDIDWLSAMTNEGESKPDTLLDKRIKKNEGTTRRKAALPEMPALETTEKEDNKGRYTFSLTPSAREELTKLRKKYKRRSDSAFLEELIWKLSEGK